MEICIGETLSKSGLEFSVNTILVVVMSSRREQAGILEGLQYTGVMKPYNLDTLKLIAL